MYSRRLQKFIKLERWLSGTLGVLAGLLLSVLSEWILQFQTTSWIGVLTGAIFILAIVLFIARWRHPYQDIDVAIKTPKIIRSEAQRRRYTRRGFVGFVPLYRPRKGSPAANLSPEARQKAVKTHRWDILDVEHSNLFPTIQAIVQHAGKLEHCWLLTTSGKDEAGSAPYAPLLVKYLKAQKGLTCKFHTGTIYNIQLEDDALVLNNTFEQIKNVFDQATRLGLSPQDLIVDFTTGVRSMALGMILASLNGDRDLEFMGTHYDKSGRPKPDELYPIIFSFEPEIPSD